MAIWKMIDDLKNNSKMSQSDSQLPNNSENNSSIQQNSNTENGNIAQEQNNSSNESNTEDNNGFQSESESSQLSNGKEEKSSAPNDSQNNTQSKKESSGTQSSTINNSENNNQSSKTNDGHKQENSQSAKEEVKELDTDESTLEKQPNHEIEQETNVSNIEGNSEHDYDKLSISEKLELLKEIKRIIEESKASKSLKDDLMDDIGRKHPNSNLAKHIRYALHNERKAYSKSCEEEYDVNNPNVDLMDKLSELPSFENRKRGPGFSFDLSSIPDVSELIIRNLIEKFLKQRFIRNTSDLNKRGLSSEKTKGFYKWDTVPLSVHLKTKQLNRLLTDKYDYDYDKDGEENVPLSFYFDLSGSMNNFSSTLAAIALELLKHDVKVLVGFNEKVNFQIDSVSEKMSVEELTNIILSMVSYDFQYFKHKDVDAKIVNKNIDNYLIESHGEKCVVFTDFDPIKEVCNLSNYCEVYWFNFEQRRSRMDFNSFNGFVYDVSDLSDIAKGLDKINTSKFKTLCYIKREERR